MRKILIITLMAVGLGILNVSIALTGSALACFTGETEKGHNYGQIAYQKDTIPPPSSSYGNHNHGQVNRNRVAIATENIPEDCYGCGAENHSRGTGGHSGHQPKSGWV